MSNPPATKIGASSQPPLIPCSSSQSPSSSSRSEASSGDSGGACRTFLTNSSWAITSFFSCCPAILPEAIMASLCRMPSTRSRSATVARPAAAAGLLSSWVSPAESLPSASSRSRSPSSGVALAHPHQHALEQVHGHREPAGELGGELAGRQREQHGVADRPHRRPVVPGRLVVQVELRRSEVDAELVGAGGLDAIPADHAAHRDLARQQHVEAGRGVALDDDVVAHRDLDHVAVRREPGQLVVVQLGEQEQLPQLGCAEPVTGWPVPRSLPLSLFLSLFRQVSMHQRHGHCSFADGRGDPLDRLGPHVTGHEHARDAGFQVVGIAVQRPTGRAPALDHQVGSGLARTRVRRAGPRRRASRCAAPRR